MQVRVRPAERRLEDVVELRHRAVAADLEAAPDGWLHLIDVDTDGEEPHAITCRRQRHLRPRRWWCEEPARDAFRRARGRAPGGHAERRTGHAAGA